MPLDDERSLRAREKPIVGGLPDVVGIGAAMRLTPQLGVHLRGLVDELLVQPYPGATLTRAQREMLATATSAGNGCFFCMDSHAAHAAALLERDRERDRQRDGDRDGVRHADGEATALLEGIKEGTSHGVGAKMEALLRIARTVRRDPRRLTARDTEEARSVGATDGDVQLAVLIAAAFSMYNRLVDGFRARTPADVGAYREGAIGIAENGYSSRQRSARSAEADVPD